MAEWNEAVLHKRRGARGRCLCVSLPNDVSGAARGGTSSTRPVLAALGGTGFVVRPKIEPHARTEKHQRTEVRSRPPVRSRGAECALGRWVQLSRRVNLKWTRRDGTLTFNIRGARKSGPTARRSGVGKIGGQSCCAAARERTWSPPRSSCFPRSQAPASIPSAREIHSR
jgi:hypothetical protein